MSFDTSYGDFRRMSTGNYNQFTNPNKVINISSMRNPMEGRSENIYLSHITNQYVNKIWFIYYLTIL